MGFAQSPYFHTRVQGLKRITIFRLTILRSLSSPFNRKYEGLGTQITLISHNEDLPIPMSRREGTKKFSLSRWHKNFIP